MTFDAIRAIADAVLLEGYVLYPYRASSTKNRYRWTFGVLAPRAWSEGLRGCEPWSARCEWLLEPDAPRATLEARIRFLQLQRRTVEARDDDGFREVSSLARADGELVVPWEEGVVREVSLGPFEISELEAAPRDVAIAVPAGLDEELVLDGGGTTAGRVLRNRWEVEGRARVTCRRCGRDQRLLRIGVYLENRTRVDEAGVRAPREEALRHALISTHVLAHVEGGRFLSVQDPPEHAREASEECASDRLHVVLAGEPGRSDLVLASPIILYDHPRIAPESQGDFFDAGEIDALLTLRTTTLTEAEKREMRATDARAAEILERVDHIPPEVMARLHGAVRELATIEESGASPPGPGAPRWAPGARVRLCPGARRTDAQDLLYAGRSATIERVLEDIDGQTCLAVTIDDDPAAELHRWYGRFHYYYPDEVELLPALGDEESV